MATKAAAAIGSQLKVGSGGSPETFTAIAEVLSLGGPEISAEEIDVTSLDSTGGYKEYITGLKDGGTMAIECNWIKSNAQQLALRDGLDANQSFNFELEFSDSPATVATFSGKVTQFSMNAEPGSQIKASMSIKISGQVTWS